VIDLVTSIAAKKSIAVSLSAHPGLGPLAADEQKFKQVLYNLLSNALKFTPIGGAVSVELAPAPPGGPQRLQLRVKDSGIGVDKAHLELMFEEFVQVDAPNAAKHPGTGLGLTLTRRIVELHGGRIWAESEGVGHGCCFVVEFPHESGAPVAPRAMPAKGRGTVLVVDDSELDRELVIALLDASGYEVLTAKDAEEGLQMATMHAPDLILMDIDLPGIDGFEATRRLKRDPRTSHIPVLAVSARAKPTDSAAALAAGCAIHISKPFDTRTFKTVVHEIMRSMKRARGMK
jgi:CheY-like chemotaxis protein